jgi:hypothetical protein
MPWKDSTIMDERIRFIARCWEGSRWPLCAGFNISRKTGYKIFDRYKECKAIRGGLYFRWPTFR